MKTNELNQKTKQIRKDVKSYGETLNVGIDIFGKEINKAKSIDELHKIMRKYRDSYESKMYSIRTAIIEQVTTGVMLHTKEAEEICKSINRLKRKYIQSQYNLLVAKENEIKNNTY